MTEPAIRLYPLRGIPAVVPGDDLAAQILEAAQRDAIELSDGALLVCQKVVSKAEGRVVRLADVEPGDEARRMDPRPPDLTQLAARNEALLRLEVLVRVIDGRRRWLWG